MKAAVRAYAAFIRSYAGCIRALHTSVWSLHTGVMRPALRRYAGCSMLQLAARRSYAGFCSLHAGCCSLHTPVCRLQPKSLGCIRLHFLKNARGWWPPVSVSIPGSACASVYCYFVLFLLCLCMILCAKFINKLKINKCCSRPHGRHGVRHGLDWPPHADSSDLRGERCNFVTMSNSYRIGAY